MLCGGGGGQRQRDDEFFIPHHHGIGITDLYSASSGNINGDMLNKDCGFGEQLRSE